MQWQLDTSLDPNPIEITLVPSTHADIQPINFLYQIEFNQFFSHKHNMGLYYYESSFHHQLYLWNYFKVKNLMT